MSVTQEIPLEAAARAEDPVPVLYEPCTAGWVTGGHNWRFKGVTATVKVPDLPDSYPHPDAQIGLHGWTENNYFVVIGVPTSGKIYYVYDVGTSSSENEHVLFQLPEVEVDDVVEMEIIHNRAVHQEELRVTTNRGTPEELTATVTIPILAGQIDQVFYRHVMWSINVDGNSVVLPAEYDKRLWKFHDCHATSEGVHGEIEGGIFSPPHTPDNPDAPDLWATWRQIVTREASPTGDVLVTPGIPWPADNPVNFGMIINPEKHPAPQIYGTTTAGWRTGGHDWRFKKINATVKVLPLPEGYPEATIGLQGFMENPYGLSIGISGDCGGGARAHYGYDFGTVKKLSIPFTTPLHAGDKVKMEIVHDHDAGQEVFTLTKEGAPPETHTVPIPGGLNVFYGHAGWNSYIDGTNFPLFTEKKKLWLYEDCHVTSEGVHGEITGHVFGPWDTWCQIVTRTGGPTADFVLVPRRPWADDPAKFRMILHEKTETSG